MDREIIDYDMAVAVTGRALAVDVGARMKHGWKPYGQPFATANNLYQAMVKYAPVNNG